MRSSTRVAPLLLLLALAAGCAGRLPRPQGGEGAPLARAAVERFLQLAAAKDYVQMGWVFGTAEGPILRRDPVPDVERRMYALASVLEHDAFTVRGEAPVPGRVGGASAFEVELRRGERRLVVPITAVRGPDGRWFVELVDVQAVTNAR